jgi:excisionase family DNA binding protein
MVYADEQIPPREEKRRADLPAADCCTDLQGARTRLTLSAALGVVGPMPRTPKTVPGMRSDETPRLSVAELRAMLLEAEAREQAEVARLREEVDRLRAERTSAAVAPDPALGVPSALVSTARSLPPVMTVAEAADALRVSEPTIRAWIRRRKLVAGQSGPGGRIRISRDAVLSLLSSK